MLVDEGYEGGGDPGRRLPVPRRERPPRTSAARTTPTTRAGRRSAATPGSVYRTSARRPTSLDLNAQDYSDTTLWSELGGKVGSVYEYMGEDGTLDLGAQNYTDLGFWKPVTETRALPAGFNITQSPSTAIGGIVVLNDVRSETLALHQERRRRRPRASRSPRSSRRPDPRVADSTALSSGGSSFTGQGTSLALNGVITTNRILSKAERIRRRQRR